MALPKIALARISTIHTYEVTGKELAVLLKASEQESLATNFFGLCVGVFATTVVGWATLSAPPVEVLAALIGVSFASGLLSFFFGVMWWRGRRWRVEGFNTIFERSPPSPPGE